MNDPHLLHPAMPSRRGRARTSLFAQGEPMLWITGGGLTLSIFMIVGLLGLILTQGLATLWPRSVVRFETRSGAVCMGEVTRRENAGPEGVRQIVRTGNYELTSEHYRWISDTDIVSRSEPEWALTIERLAWGRFYGFPAGFQQDGKIVADRPDAVWTLFKRTHKEARARWKERTKLETVAVGALNRRLDAARRAARGAELKYGAAAPQTVKAIARFDAVSAETEGAFRNLQDRIRTLNEENARTALLLKTADGKEKTILLADIVRAIPANRLTLFGRVGVFLSRWLEFLIADPREANSEGGVFPAIFGTVVMTLLMSLAVVPFGVMAALYLREYARAGPWISVVRISINNLAGVPSIVFGVFGLGFFCYLTGATIDQLFFADRLPNPTYGKGGLLWASLTLALMTLPVVIVATEEALAAVPGSMREGSYGCGASKWQTIRRIVLPRALPGIMTGMILAMARGAGEVAPLMLVGAVKLAPELPVDGAFPFVHPERSFMHLGFHIFDLGFQSQNSEAAKPMVYTTTLLLIAMIFILNLLAVRLRTRLRRKFVSSVF